MKGAQHRDPEIALHNPLSDPPLWGGGLSEPQYGFMGGLNAPIILIVITGQAQRSMLVGELNLLGLPGETMRRMVPFKWIWTNLIAAWETTSPQGAGSRCLLSVKELLVRHARCMSLTWLVPSDINVDVLAQ
jgi:hypothetical protein